MDSWVNSSTVCRVTLGTPKATIQGLLGLCLPFHFLLSSAQEGLLTYCFTDPAWWPLIPRVVSGHVGSSWLRREERVPVCSCVVHSIVVSQPAPFQRCLSSPTLPPTCPLGFNHVACGLALSLNTTSPNTLRSWPSHPSGHAQVSCDLGTRHGDYSKSGKSRQGTGARQPPGMQVQNRMMDFLSIFTKGHKEETEVDPSVTSVQFAMGSILFHTTTYSQHFLPKETIYTVVDCCWFFFPLLLIHLFYKATTGRVLPPLT